MLLLLHLTKYSYIIDHTLLFLPYSKQRTEQSIHKIQSHHHG